MQNSNRLFPITVSNDPCQNKFNYASAKSLGRRGLVGTWGLLEHWVFLFQLIMILQKNTIRPGAREVYSCEKRPNNGPHRLKGDHPHITKCIAAGSAERLSRPKPPKYGRHKPKSYFPWFLGDFMEYWHNTTSCTHVLWLKNTITNCFYVREVLSPQEIPQWVAV